MNILNINKPSIEKQIELLQHDILTLRNLVSQVITALTFFEGYDTMEEDFIEIKKTIIENDLKFLDIKNLPDCIKIKYTDSQVVLYSMNIIRNLLITGNSESKIIQ